MIQLEVHFHGSNQAGLAAGEGQNMAQTGRDWHPEDIKAAVRRSGITLMALSAEYGLAKQACSTTLMRPWPRVQAIIADRIGVEPKAIWPSRYDTNGTPLSYREITAPDVVVPSQKRKAD